MKQPVDVDTIFFGGGTPTHLHTDQLHRLMQLVLHWFRLCDGGEFSIEANPSDTSREKVAELKALIEQNYAWALKIDFELPDAIARVLDKRYQKEDESGNGTYRNSLMGEKCPSCSQTISFEEGCMTCHFCGFSKCG